MSAGKEFPGVTNKDKKLAAYPNKKPPNRLKT